MIRGWLLSGGGNDFLALLEPPGDPGREQIAAWCRRGISLGADGVFALRRQASDRVEMRYWNADGTPAGLCLNGTRCAARLALAVGWCSGVFTVETGAGPIRAQAAGDTEVALEPPVPVAAPRPVEPTLDALRIAGWWVDVGVPHFVVPWHESLARCPVATLGARLRRHPDFEPSGANVDFVRFPDRHRLEIRTFERGVEAETLACGTGILAAIAAGLEANHLDLPVRTLTLGGFRFNVAGTRIGQRLERWSFAGDARLLGEVEIHDEAALPPPPRPAWSD